MVRTTLVATQLFKSRIGGISKVKADCLFLICSELLFALYCNFWHIFSRFLILNNKVAWCLEDLWQKSRNERREKEIENDKGKGEEPEPKSNRKRSENNGEKWKATERRDSVKLKYKDCVKWERVEPTNNGWLKSKGYEKWDATERRKSGKQSYSGREKWEGPEPKKNGWLK